MSQADLAFLVPLLELVGPYTDDETIEDMSLGLRQVHPDSELARDDVGLDGRWVSVVVISGLTAAIDHIVTLRDLLRRERPIITVNAPWTLLRGALEPAATALWVLAGDTRRVRQARALKVWHHDYCERQKWEDDTDATVPAHGKAGKERAAEIVGLATQLGIKPTTVTAKFSYYDTVGAAGDAAGWPRKSAQARWREASGFAHGKFWPMPRLTTPRSAERIPGGFGMAFVMDKERLAEVTRLTHDVLRAALEAYERSAAAPRESR